VNQTWCEDWRRAWFPAALCEVALASKMATLSMEET